MKRNDFAGTGKVFGFTLRQLVMNRANLISLLITGVIMVLMFPAMTFLKGVGSDGPSTAEPPEGEWVMQLPDKIYFTDETDLGVNPAQYDYAEIPVKYIELTNETYADTVNSDANEAWVHLYQGETGYFVDVYAQPDVTDPLAAHITDLLDQARYTGMDGIDVLNAPYSISSSSLDEYEDPDETDGMGAYYVQLIYSILSVMMVTLVYIMES